MATDYTVLATAVARTLERSGTTDEDLATELLELTAGKNAGGTTVYRPYYAAARILRQARSSLRSGDGAVFRRPLAEAQDLERLQAQLDEAQDLTVPDAFLAWANPIVGWGPA